MDMNDYAIHLPGILRRQRLLEMESLMVKAWMERAEKSAN